MTEKVAVVIGGGQTLGQYLSEGIAIDGDYTVAVADINYDNAKQVADDIVNKGYKAKGYFVDATNEDSVIALMNNICNDFARIDLLVYSTGVSRPNNVIDTSLKDFEFVVNVNLNGYFLCAREAAKIMIDKGIHGSIIQINSKSGKVGSKHNSSYSASKFGGIGLTQSLALDLADYGITVNALMLGNLLKSPMFQALIPQCAKKLNIAEDEVEQLYINKVPLKRGCEYKDVLAILLFYASEKAAYCTGQSINITGGQVMF